jgi:hypothetical protein
MSLCSKQQKFVAQLSAVAFAFGILSVLFIPSSNIAHAASNGTGSTITETKSISLPASDCKAIAKKFPQLASKLGNCHITIVSTSTELPGFTTKTVKQKRVGLTPAIALSCPSGTIFHSIQFSGSGGLYGASMREYFTWHGNCSAPSVTQQNCVYDQWAYIPYSSIVKNYCDVYQDGSNAVAEGGWTVSYYLQVGTFTEIADASASGNNTIVSDATS